MNKSVVKYTLPLHIGFFVYQYAKLRMLQFYYDFVDRYVERPLFQYCEIDSAYIALAGESIDGLVRADRRAHYFRHRSQLLPAECCDEHEDDYVRARIAGRSWTATESCCFARKAFNKRTPGLFKVEWCGEGFIGLCSKTYYCFGATDKYTTKGLSKRHNDIDKWWWVQSGLSRARFIRDDVRSRASRANLLLGAAQRTRRRSQHGASGSVKGQPDDHSFTHMDPRWKHPFTCIVAGPTGCGKTTFVARLLRNASTMIDHSPVRVTWYYGEWQSAYENLDIPNLHLEEGLPTSFDASKHNIVVLDDLMAENDERVTKPFTKKSITVIHQLYISCKTCFQKNKESRTISLNSQYIVVFKNPRDVSQMTTLAKQMYPGRVKFVQEATSTPYVYILVDLKQDTPRIYACARPYYRTTVFSMYTCQKYK